jgi:GAF domain-containing protein
MDAPTRESRINAAFVAVADTLTSDFDVIELLNTLVVECTEILNVDAGGLMLADGSGRLQLMASTSEDADLVETMQLASDSGPCIECFTTGAPVSVADMAEIEERWPEFFAAAMAGGFGSAHATPLKLRGEIIGTLNLFATRSGDLTEADIALAQALSDVATISLLQERFSRESNVVAEQLQNALNSRITIEQAKGMLAHSHSLSMGEAFALLRAYARSNNLTIRAVAEGITEREISLSTLSPAAQNG